MPVVPLRQLYDSVVEFEELVNRSGGIEPLKTESHDSNVRKLLTKAQGALNRRGFLTVLGLAILKEDGDIRGGYSTLNLC